MVAVSLDARRLQAVRSKWADLVLRARGDVNTFIEATFKDDQTKGGPPFQQQWFHREWQALWNERISVLHGPTGFGKSEQLVGRTLWELGNDATWRVAIVRKSNDVAKPLVAKIQRQIEHNALARAIFPNLRPGAPWGAEGLRLATAGVDTTTNSVTPYGIDGPLLGSRADRLFGDDVNDPENTQTEEARKKGIKWADEVAQSRLTTHGRMAFVANAWHLQDIAHVYSRRPGVAYKKYQAENQVTGEVLWPDFRGRAYLEALKRTMSPNAYARTMLCLVADDATRIFSAALIARAKRCGAGMKPLLSVTHATSRDGVPSADAIMWGSPVTREEYEVIIGVDLATGETEKKRKSDFTVFFVVGVNRTSGDRRVLSIQRGRWTGPVALRKLAALRERFDPVRIVVESNAQQRFFIDFANEVEGWESVIEPFHTSREKWSESLGVEGIAGEMMADRWQIPGPALGQSEAGYVASLTPSEAAAYEAIQEWLEGLLDFQRVGHTSDTTMAMWFAREGALRLAAGTFKHTKAQEMGAPPEEWLDEQIHGQGTTVARILKNIDPDDQDEARKFLGM